MSVIPTTLRAKIGKTLSYPIGAEAVSAVLQDTPQFGKLRISFHNRYQRLKDRGQPYSILTVSFLGRERTVSAEDDEWAISIRPIPRDRKHKLKTELQVEVLPKIREWLLEHAALERRHELRYIDVTYDERVKTLKVEEHRAR